MARVLIVDGYNVIHAAPRYKSLIDVDIDTARANLINDVALYAEGSFSATVVFDGATNPYSDGIAREVAGVYVIFSPHGSDADSVIEDLAGRYCKKGDRVTVVTSDSETQWVVVGQGATRVSSAEFISELIETDEEYADHAPKNLQRVGVEDRIDPSVREALKRIADGR